MDPLYTATIINDFSLQAASPCIGAASAGYDIGSVPYTVRPEYPTAVTMAPVGETLAVDLSWTNPTHDLAGNALTGLNGVQIFRDETLIHTVTPAAPGESMAYTDNGPSNANHTYTIAAVDDVGMAGLRFHTCEQWIGPPLTGILIWDLGSTSSSGVRVADAISTAGYAGGVNRLTNAFAYPLSAANFDAVFVCLGIFADNHVLTDSEGQLLADFLDAGGSVYMEGGDTWFYDAATPVHPYFKIDGLADGTGDCGPVNGVPRTLTEGMSFTYSGYNSYIDQLSPQLGAVAIFKNGSPVYDSCVSYAGLGGYRTIGCSFDFGGLDDGSSPSTKAELMAAMLDFFGLGAPDTTIAAGLTCLPGSGTVPFNTSMTVTMWNVYEGLTRRMAGRLDVDLAGGQSFSNWKSGWSNIDPGGSLVSGWNQGIPALGNVIGDNVFTFLAEDVTPSPYNQAPHPPSGDTDMVSCTVTGVAP